MPTEKQLADADRILREFDWSAIDKMSDEEIRAAWAWDEDTVWPTDAELAEFDLVIPAKSRKLQPKEAAE